jgi:hypothetical protein
MSVSSEADLAALRALAEEGRHSPLAGGRVLVWFGVAVPVASLLFWALGQMPDVPRQLWLGATIGFAVLAGAAGAALMRAGGGLQPRATVLARAEALVWGASGLAMMTYTAVLVLRGLLGLDTPPNVIGSLATVGFLHYAVAYAVTAGLSRQRWLRLPAAGSFAAAAMCGLIADSDLVMPVSALLLLVLALVPGVILMRAERAAA